MNRHYYVFEHTCGNAVWGHSGKPVGIIRRFDSRAAASSFVNEFRAPNHCPSAFAERVTRRSIQNLLPDVFWFSPSADGSHEEAAI